jgi:hypothetical protein
MKKADSSHEATQQIAAELIKLLGKGNLDQTMVSLEMAVGLMIVSATPSEADRNRMLDTFMRNVKAHIEVRPHVPFLN